MSRQRAVAADARLRARYIIIRDNKIPLPGWAFRQQLRRGTGFKSTLTEDAYLVRYTGPRMEVLVERLVSDRTSGSTWVLPTYIRSRTAKTPVKLEAVTVTHHGRRERATWKRIQRYLALLKQGLDNQPESSRYVFISPRATATSETSPKPSSGMKRADMGGWDEEVWYSVYRSRDCGISWDSRGLSSSTRICGPFAFRPNPDRTHYTMSRDSTAKPAVSPRLLFSRAVIDTPYPDDILFIEKNITSPNCARIRHLLHHLGKHEEAARVKTQ